MKIRKTVIILVIAFAVLGVAYYFVSNLNPNKQPSENNQSIKVYEVDASLVSAITLNTQNEEFTFLRSGSSWVVSGKEYIELDHHAIASLCGNLASIQALRQITPKEDLSHYGFGTPLSTVTLSLSDGTKKVFVLGDKLPDNTGYYFKDSDSDYVYTISVSDGNLLCTSLLGFRSLTVTNFDTSDITALSIRNGSNTISMYYHEHENTADVYGVLSMWRMQKPYERDADNESVSQLLLTPISSITAYGVAEDNPSNLAKYGFGNTDFEITVGNEVYSYQIGFDDQNAYIYIPGHSAVYMVEHMALSFLSVDFFDVVERYIHLVDLDYMNTTVITTPAFSATLSTEGTGDNQKYYFNGKALSLEKFRELYQPLVGGEVDGVLPSDYSKAGKERVAGIVFTLKDGTKKTFEYYHYNDLNYAVAENGDCLFYMKKKTLSHMLSALEK